MQVITSVAQVAYCIRGTVQNDLSASGSTANNEPELWMLHHAQSQRAPPLTTCNNTTTYRQSDK